MTDNTGQKRIIPYAVVSPLTVGSSSEDATRQSRKRKRVADMTSEERAEKQHKRYICICMGVRVQGMMYLIEKSETGSLLRIRATKENSTSLIWKYK